jgi:hypothetical protein
LGQESLSRRKKMRRPAPQGHSRNRGPLKRALEFRSSGIAHSSAIDPISVVDTAIMPVIAEDTAIPWVKDKEAGVLIYELIADGLGVSCQGGGACNRAQHEEINDDSHDLVSMKA